MEVSKKLGIFRLLFWGPQGPKAHLSPWNISQGSAMVSAGEIYLPWSLGDVTTKQRFWGLRYSWEFNGCMINIYIYDYIYAYDYIYDDI